MVWGQYERNNISSQIVISFSLESKSNIQLNDTEGLGYNTKQVAFASANMCISDSSDSQSAGVWCLADDFIWRNITKLSESATMPESQVVTSQYLLAFGGFDSNSQATSDTLAYSDTDGMWIQIGIKSRIPAPRAMSTSVILDNSWFVFGGISVRKDYSNSIYKLEINELWCHGITSVNASSEILTDGSGSFPYSRDTNCTWLLEGINYIIIQEIDIGNGAVLSIEKEGDCDGDLELDKSKMAKINILPTHKNMTLHIPSGNSKLNFVTSPNAEAKQGFKFRVLYCGIGYLISTSGCYCPHGSFVNFRGDCVPCSDGPTRLYGDSEKCPRNMNSFGSSMTIEEASPIIKNLNRSQIRILDSGPPTLAYASAAIIQDKVYLVGGKSAASRLDDTLYQPMSIVYVGTSTKGTIWSPETFSGSIPAPRESACLVSDGSFGYLLGGKTLQKDSSVYKIDPETREWKIIGGDSDSVEGAACVLNGRKIVVYGGIKENGDYSQDLRTFDLDSGVWSLISSEKTNPYFAHGAFFLKSSKLHLVSGMRGDQSSNNMDSFDLVTNKWISSKEIKFSECLKCDQFDGSCTLDRHHFAFTTRDSTLVIYGGISNGAVLQDIIQIDTEKGIVFDQKDFSVESPGAPLVFPPPKYAAAFVSKEDDFQLIGGLTYGNVATGDTWTWNSELATWSDTSIVYFPIQRTQSAMTKIDSACFVMFGGATPYSMEVLLNDLWQFCADTAEWTLLHRGGKDSMTPTRRADAIIGFWDRKVYITGGRRLNSDPDLNEIWAFSFGSSSWKKITLKIELAVNENPMLRLGVRGIQIGSKLWIWGGQLPGGYEHPEKYNSYFSLDLETATMSSTKISLPISMARKNHALCKSKDGSIVATGGSTLLNSLEKDILIIGQGVNMHHNRSNSVPTVSNHICVPYENGIILAGGDRSQPGTYWMVDSGNKSSTSVPLHVDDPYYASQSFSGVAGTTVDGIIITFGGSNSLSVSHKVVAYNPGFCSANIQTVQGSDKSAKIMEDGSGDLDYFVNSTCKWDFIDANQMHVSHHMSSNHRLKVSERGGSRRLLYQNSAEGVYSVSLSSESGFIVEFDTSEIDSAQKVGDNCKSCKGFQISYAACQTNAFLDSGRGLCVCQSGYTEDQGQCTEKDTDSVPVGMISGASAAFVIVLGVALFWYRRKMIKQVETANKLLYGHIPSNELAYETLIGSGAFGEVYSGYWRGTEVAIKKLHGKMIDKQAVEVFKAEISIMV
eukprot:TRINITY_DN8675_c0_g3_i7.p1 TRINITY_DN8675_c0_g3~~TRINITY_DN8675_c0_g3_i7.p1  ORF type:complete len:1244 (-),score=201.75 TRINITY_DN8675_c0_g3_i7:66-3797(-)